MPEESRVKSCERQHNADIRDQPFPELMLKSAKIGDDHESIAMRYSTSAFARLRKWGISSHQKAFASSEPEGRV